MRLPTLRSLYTSQAPTDFPAEEREGSGSPAPFLPTLPPYFSPSIDPPFLRRLDFGVLRDELSLDGLDEELEGYNCNDEVANILAKGRKEPDYVKGAESKLAQVEQELVQEYIKGSDNLVLLHGQIHDCDIILSQIGSLIDGFQVEIGSISSEIRSLQDKSTEIRVNLNNRKIVETKLAKFIEEIIARPSMVYTIVNGEVNEEYLIQLEVLSKKLKFVEVDYLINSSEALKDIKPELERLRQKAISKVFEFIIEMFYAFRKPKTNIQILQQSLLRKYQCLILFLKEHGKEIYNDVLEVYVDSMNKVLGAHFRVYIQALGRLQMNIITSNDLGHAIKGREHLKNRSSIFSLGERISILKEIDQPALIPHIAEAKSLKYSYEVLFRSLHKLLIDTACSEYLFVESFFGEESLFHDVFAGPFAAIDEHLSQFIPNCYDAICLLLMICITRKHQLIMSSRSIPCLDSYLDKVMIHLWPRFKMVFDMHLQSLNNCDLKTLSKNDVHPHPTIRCYAEFAASLVRLNVEYVGCQLDLNLERLQIAVDDLLVKLAVYFKKPKLQALFFINNYDMIISVLKEASAIVGKMQIHYEEKLENNVILFMDELLMDHFSNLIKFVRSCGSEDLTSYREQPTIADVEPLVKDFALRWKLVLELMHKEVITSFSNLLCGMEVLKAAMAQLLNYYNRLSECVKMIPGGSAVNKGLVSITSISYEIRKYSRTF